MKFVKADVQLRLRIMGNCMGTFSPRAPATASSSQIRSWIGRLETISVCSRSGPVAQSMHTLHFRHKRSLASIRVLEHCHFETQINQYLVSVRQFLKIKRLITLPLLTTLHSVN